jgi:hypothetical protein
MKKTLSLICIIGMIIIIAGCSTPEELPVNNANETTPDTTALITTETPANSTAPQTTENADDTDPLRGGGIIASEDDMPTGTANLENRTILMEERFDTIEELTAFVNKDEALRSSHVSSFFIMPKYQIPGFELVEVMAGASDVIGGITLYYTRIGFVDTDPNDYASARAATVSYATHKYEEELEPFDGEMWANYRNNLGYEILKINGEMIFYRHYTYHDKVLGHDFAIQSHGMLVHAVLPLVDGLDRYDMVKYLEMVPVM